MLDRVTICECLGRDGLQHEEAPLETGTKLALIEKIAEAGFTRIEATSYSHPDQVPAFRDASEVLAGVPRKAGVSYKATCPNPRAVARAIADAEAGRGADELSLLVSATESHSARNLRSTRTEQWAKVQEMASMARDRFTLVGVLSVAFGCPFEGAVDPEIVLADVERFAVLGVDLVTIGDTTGLGTPRSVGQLFARLAKEIPEVGAVAHFHNTRGTALANCVAALDAGCRHFDSSLGGVGGHPSQIHYGEGSTGNAATEDLVNLFESMGVDTGLDLPAVMACSRAAETALGRPLHSMVARSGWGLTDATGRHDG